MRFWPARFALLLAVAKTDCGFAIDGRASTTIQVRQPNNAHGVSHSTAEAPQSEALAPASQVNLFDLRAKLKAYFNQPTPLSLTAKEAKHLWGVDSVHEKNQNSEGVFDTKEYLEGAEPLLKELELALDACLADRCGPTKNTKAQMAELSQLISYVWARSHFHRMMVETDLGSEMRFIKVAPSWGQLSRLQELREKVKKVGGLHLNPPIKIVVADTVGQSGGSIPKKKLLGADGTVFHRSGLAMSEKLGAKYAQIGHRADLGPELIMPTALNPVSDLRVVAHGLPGQIFVADKILQSSDFDVLKYDTSSDTKVVIYACEVAQGDSGQKYVKDIAEKMLPRGGQITAFIYPGAIYKIGNVYFDLEKGPQPTYRSLPNTLNVGDEKVTFTYKVEAKK
jgi:hypothetical protein